MKAPNIPPAEQLPPKERLARVARDIGDCLLSGMRGLSFIVPKESSYAYMKNQIEELQNIANDPWEHTPPGQL